MKETYFLDVRRVLKTWGIRNFKAKKIIGGLSCLNWLIVTSDKKYVLRNADSDFDWLEWQLAVINRLVERNFSCFVPNPIPNLEDLPYTEYKSDYWFLYAFIDGHPLGHEPNLHQVKGAGKMVAKYHRIIKDLNYKNACFYEIKLFDFENTIQNFFSIQKRLQLKGGRDQLVSLFLSKEKEIFEAYIKVSEGKDYAINTMPKIPVHYDLHGFNILGLDDQVIGLIDFDSVGLGPRIIDIQNALTHLTGTRIGINTLKMHEFINAYTSVFPCTENELSAVYSLLLERLFVKVIGNLNRKNEYFYSAGEFARRMLRINDRDNLRLLSILIWIIENEKRFHDCLWNAAAKADCC